MLCQVRFPRYSNLNMPKRYISETFVLYSVLSQRTYMCYVISHLLSTKLHAIEFAFTLRETVIIVRLRYPTDPKCKCVLHSKQICIASHAPQGQSHATRELLARIYADGRYLRVYGKKISKILSRKYSVEDKHYLKGEK